LECVKDYFRQQDHFKEGELIFGRTGLFTFFFPQCDKKQQQRSFNALLPASNCEMEKRLNSISVKTKNEKSFCFILRLELLFCPRCGCKEREKKSFPKPGT
jgi:hypothetical protein